MTAVRKIETEIDAQGYPAIERTLIERIGSGESPPTAMEWTFDSDLFLILGPVEDAALIDRETAIEHEIDYGRRYNVGGGTGFFKSDFAPTLCVMFPDRGEHTMTEYIDLAGEAMAEALRTAGLEDAVYDDGGDVELMPDEPGEQRAKLGATGAGYQDGVWGVMANVLNKSYSPEQFELIDDVLQLPEEKFADKETDSAAGRMTSLREVAPEIEVETVLEEAIENLAELAGDSLESGSFTDPERAAIEDYREEFGTDSWFTHYSTATILEGADEDDRVAEVAYKAEKLIKASVRVSPSDRITDIQFTGDIYHRPGYEGIDRLNEAVTGVDITDDDALLAAIEDVYAADDFEVPWLEPEEFRKPLLRAQQELMPVDEFTRG